MPVLPQLTTLSVSSNSITNIELFLNKIVVCFPKLKWLSTLGNEACPRLDRLEHRYYNYRIYVISRLKFLKTLDASDVTDAERSHAVWIQENDDEKRE